MVASDTYRKPLLQFEQPPSLCAKLPRPMAKEVSGNVYVRPTMTAPLIQMSPVANDTCVARLRSLDEFRKLVPAFDANGRQFDWTPRTIFKSPDVGRYELQIAVPETSVDVLPPDVRKLLGRSEEEARSPGAYPFKH